MRGWVHTRSLGVNGGQEADVIAMLGVPLSVWVYVYSVHIAFSGPTPPARCVCLRGGNNPSLCQHLHGQASFLSTLSRQFLSAWKHQLLT